MSAADHPIMNQMPAGPQPKSSKEFELGLVVPQGFKTAPLFPKDRLFRLHPHWFVNEFTEKNGAFTVRIKDYSSEDEFALAGQLSYDINDTNLITIQLEKGIDMTITFLKSSGRLKARLSTPGTPVDDDHPILLWVRAIREYLLLYIKTTPWSFFFRLIMNRMILQMNPSQRKISIMITKITVIEVLVIILIVVGYVIFNQ